MITWKPLFLDIPGRFNATPVKIPGSVRHVPKCAEREDGFHNVFSPLRM